MITTGNPMHYVDVSEKDIMDVMTVCGKAVDGKEENVVFLGLLALAIFMRNPTMNGEQLRDGVRGASEWVALYADTIGERVN